jgi:hypothetical protein
VKPAAGYRGPLAYSSPEVVQTTGTVADGLLNPSEIAEGLVALRDLNEFLFQAPICLLSSGLSDGFAADAGEMNIRFARSYNDLALVKLHPKLQAGKKSDNYLWIEGSIKAHRYDVVSFRISSKPLLSSCVTFYRLRRRPGSHSGMSLSIGRRCSRLVHLCFLRKKGIRCRSSPCLSRRAEARGQIGRSPSIVTRCMTRRWPW